MARWWISDYLRSVRQMVDEADRSTDPRVKLTALRILERQASTIRDLESEHWADLLGRQELL